MAALGRVLGELFADLTVDLVPETETSFTSLQQLPVTAPCTCRRARSSPEGGPQDAVADDEVKFLQVGGGTLLQHAVPLQAVVALRQPPRHLPQTSSRKKELLGLKSGGLALELKVQYTNVRGAGATLTSSVILDFLFRVRDTSLCLTLFLFWLSLGLLCKHKQGSATLCDSLDTSQAASRLGLAAASHLSFHLQLLQLPLVRPLAEGLVDLGHDGDLLAAVVNDQLAFWLREISHEPQHRDPHG